MKPPSHPYGHLLIIAYGNTLRRDDGAGIALAERLVEVWQYQGITTRLICVTQLTPELAAELLAAEIAAVIFVDAAVAAQPASIQITPITAESTDAAFGHHCGPATILTYAAHLYHCQAPAWLVTVPGKDFGHGEGFSPAVNCLLAKAGEVAAAVLAEIRKMTVCMN